MTAALSLKTRLLAVAAFLIALASISTWSAFRHLTEGIIEQWGLNLVQTQVRYDRARLLQPLEREIALARQLAESSSIRRWAATPDDPARSKRAFEELESYRQNFRDRSYFVALAGTGAYYHNNAADEFKGRELRYHLSPERPADGWFYKLLEQKTALQLNVNPDAALGVTKIWINLLVRDGERVLGVAGTGMDLDDFLREIVDPGQAGVTTLFVDGEGAIQLHRDLRLIDYGSLIKPTGQKNTLARLLDREEDRLRLAELMTELRANQQEGIRVLNTFVKVKGKRYLAGLAYAPTLDWYEVTLLDLQELLPISRFVPVVLVFLATLVVTLVLLHIAVRHLLLDPLVALENAMERVRRGDLEQQPLPSGQGEVGRLIQHFAAMAAAIRDNTRQLEDKVRQRTEALERLARIDPLTQLLNRRGMTERLAHELARSYREGHGVALLWLDLDYFKTINDTLGHARGDQALMVVAEVLKDNLRTYDQASRWGGDEFLVLLAPCDEAALAQIGERIRQQVEAASAVFGTRISVSIGAHLARAPESIDQVLQHADDALYAAKAAGRNRLCCYAEAPAAPTRSQTSQA